MKFNISDSNGRRVFSLLDQMTFADRAALDQVLPQLMAGGIRELAVDMERLDYMDSAGLGMLLTLRDQASRASITVTLVKPQGDVKDLLVLACFDTLFKIEY